MSGYREAAIRAACGLFVATALAGCMGSTTNPERLFSVAYELDQVRLQKDQLAQEYYATFFSQPDRAKAVRNEILARRIYAIDLQYTEYESALTHESQRLGFAALTSAQGLTTAAALVAAPGTKTILSAVATAVLATKGHYNSEVLLAQTMRTIQKQMRASRNTYSTLIAGRMTQSVADYPLQIALSDIEDYYNAGTLTSGVIDTSTTVAAREEETRQLKQAVAQEQGAQKAQVIKENMQVIEERPALVVSPAVKR